MKSRALTIYCTDACELCMTLGIETTRYFLAERCTELPVNTIVLTTGSGRCGLKIHITWAQVMGWHDGGATTERSNRKASSSTAKSRHVGNFRNVHCKFCGACNKQIHSVHGKSTLQQHRQYYSTASTTSDGHKAAQRRDASHSDVVLTVGAIVLE